MSCWWMVRWRYHSSGNYVERFRGFLELISRFEFDVLRCRNISDDSNFWCVRGSITCSETAHVHVLWLVCTHNNYMSNVLVSVAIHDKMYI